MYKGIDGGCSRFVVSSHVSRYIILNRDVRVVLGGGNCESSMQLTESEMNQSLRGMAQCGESRVIVFGSQSIV